MSSESPFESIVSLRSRSPASCVFDSTAPSLRATSTAVDERVRASTMFESLERRNLLSNTPLPSGDGDPAVDPFLSIGADVAELRAYADYYNALPRPDATNTGPRIPVDSLNPYTSRYSTVRDGEVIEGETFLAGIQIRHDNVIVRDNVFTGTGGIKVNAGATETLIEHNAIYGVDISTGISTGDTGRSTIRFNHIYETGSDGWRVGQFSEIFAGNYVHTIGQNPSSHADAIQFYYSDPLTATGILIANNNLDLDGPRANAPIFMGARTDNVLVSNNLLLKGGYIATRGEFNAVDNTVIYEDNFLDDWRFGPHSEDLGWNAVTWHNNVELDTGASLDLAPVWESHFEWATTPHKFIFYFDQDYADEIEQSDLSIKGWLYPDFTIPADDFDMTYDVESLSLTYTYKYGTIPEGRYWVTLNLFNVEEYEPVNEDDESQLLIHYIRGDADRDRNVDFDDLLIIAKNYGTSGSAGVPRYQSGDFDYDSDVDFDDLLLFAQRYGMSAGTIPPPAAPMSASVAAIPTRRTRAASSVLS